MRPNRSLSHILFTVMIFSLVFFCMLPIGVNAETELPPIPVDPDSDTDFDSDGSDFHRLTEEYGRENCTDEPQCWFDSNLDENVNEVDLEYFAADFGRAGKDFYESDDTLEEARGVAVYYEKYQHHNFHQEADEDWMKFFAVQDESYKIEVLELLSCDVVIELYDNDGVKVDQDSIPEYMFIDDDPVPYPVRETFEWDSPPSLPPDGGDYYYVRVYPSSDPDAVCDSAANYEFGIVRPSAPFPGTIYGIVKRAGTQIPIPYALIRTANRSAMSFPNGVYIMANHPAGINPLTSTAAGYNYYTTSINVPEAQILRKDILMIP